MTHIIVHSSASPWGCVREIRKWHIEGNGWDDIGYHFVILNGQIGPKYWLSIMNGAVECGRFLNEDLTLTGKEIGAHALGYNANSIGVCVIGGMYKDKKIPFTTSQKLSLIRLLTELCLLYKVKPINIIGHCETASGKARGKTCPDMDMDNVRDCVIQALSEEKRFDC